MILPLADVTERLSKMDGWHHRGNAIEKVFDCGNFDGSIAFVNAVARAANEADHHPDIALSWNLVTLTLSSHDAGGITERDFALAAKADELAPKTP